MKTLRWSVLVVVLFVSAGIRAQAKLGVTIDSFPTQVAFLDTAVKTCNLYLHNYGDSVFNDTFSLQYLINGTIYNANTQDHGLYLPSESLSIPAHDSVLRSLAINFNLPAFLNVGSSAVVIWPISSSAATYDSLTYVVNISDSPLGVPVVSGETLQVFINQQQLYIKSGAKNLLSRVRILDIQGQLLGEHNLSLPSVIPMNGYASGCYLVEVTLTDDTRQIFRVVNAGSH